VRVALVLRDTGNTSVAGGRVTALLLPTSPGVSQRASTLAKVPTLSAGQSIYLLLGKLKVSRANSYDLLVTVTFPGGHAVRRSVRLSVAS
jgi:hypothetical protein